MTSHTDPNTGGWSRSRLILLIASVAATAVALVAGLGLAVWFALAPTPTVMSGAAPVTDAAVHGDAYRDQLAAQPMLQVPASAASTPNVAAELGPTMTLPDATSVGGRWGWRPGSRTPRRGRSPNWQRSRSPWWRR